MAVVFLARDERLGRPVALKILSPALAADAGFRRRFIAESRAAAAVDDPHIIPVFEAGESGGLLFIAMRFVAGGDLLRVLDREGPLPPGRAAGFISPVASALDAAHRAGLVHRDVKPANILVDAHADRPDHVYLSDFGVSKGAAPSVSLTGAGHFLGTPDYSAPEQIQGLTVDGRADQYALACVAFQLLAGSVPFGRDQGMAVLFAHLSEPPPRVSSRRQGLPAAADQVLARAMAKVPEKRYGSCREFADALRDALGVAPYTSPGPAAPGFRPAQAGTPRTGFTASIPAVAAGTTGLPGPAPARTVDAMPGGGQAAPGRPTEAAGRRAGAAGRPRSFRPRVAVGLAAVLAVAAGLSAYALDGGGAGTHAGGPPSVTHSPGIRPSPRTQPVAPRVIATLTDPGKKGVFAVAFGPGGTTLAAGDNDGSTYLWNLASHAITARLTDPASNGVLSVAFSPNGTSLATSDQNGSTYLWSLATHAITATVTDPKSTGASSVAFSPNGATLATSDYAGKTYLWNLVTHTITATLTDPKSTGVDWLAFSPNGTRLATSDGNGNTYVWDLATRTIIATVTDPHSVAADAVAFNPAGTTLATGDDNGNTYLWNLATHTMTAALTDPAGSEVLSVAFSPDGTTLATGDLGGDACLWRVARRVSS